MAILEVIGWIILGGGSVIAVLLIYSLFYTKSCVEQDAGKLEQLVNSSTERENK